MASVLVVEDEPQIQELVAVNLEHFGHRVRRAATAEEAEAAIRAALPDVVVLDWMLPGESGIAFARRLRADARTRVDSTVAADYKIGCHAGSFY